MKTLISTDTSALLNYEVFKKYDISVFALNVIVDGKEYLDGITIDQETLKNAMRGGSDIKTSTPPLGEIIDYFEKLFEKGYDKIIHFTISSKLSSMYDLFCTVAKNNFPDKLFVVDSRSLSAAMASHVFYVYDQLSNGVDIPDIIAEVEERKKTDACAFIPENLTALKNGGRISPAIALIGNALGIKPIIKLIDGALEKDGTTKHVKRTLVECITENASKFPVSEYDYTIVSFDGKKDVYDYVCDCANEILGEGHLVQGIVPINVCAHCGPGTIGILVTKKINGKSLKEFL